MGFIRKINVSSYINTAIQGLAWIAAIFLLLLMLYVTGDVIGRYVFNRPLPGAYELAATFLAFIVFLGLAFGEKIGINIRLLTLHDRLGKRARGITDIITYIIGVFLSGLIAQQSWKWAIDSFVRGEYMEGQINFPYYPSKFATAIGMTFLLIAFATKLIQSINQMKQKTGS